MIAAGALIESDVVLVRAEDFRCHRFVAIAVHGKFIEYHQLVDDVDDGDNCQRREEVLEFLARSPHDKENNVSRHLALRKCKLRKNITIQSLDSKHC